MQTLQYSLATVVLQLLPVTPTPVTLLLLVHLVQAPPSLDLHTDIMQRSSVLVSSVHHLTSVQSSACSIGNDT
jgi:hypothetical protein